MGQGTENDYTADTAEYADLYEFADSYEYGDELQAEIQPDCEPELSTVEIQNARLYELMELLQSPEVSRLAPFNVECVSMEIPNITVILSPVDVNNRLVEGGKFTIGLYIDIEDLVYGEWDAIS